MLIVDDTVRLLDLLLSAFRVSSRWLLSLCYCVFTSLFFITFSTDILKKKFLSRERLCAK